jgi:hypothetical protein
MALGPYPLSQEEIFRAELMSCRLVVSAFLGQFLEEHQDRRSVLKKMQGAVDQIVTQSPLEAIPAERQDRFRKLVIERSRSLIRNADNMARSAGKKT